MAQRFALLRLKPQADAVLLVVEEPGTFEHDCVDGCDFCRHLYEEKVCPEEFIGHARQIIVGSESDPHHIFEFISITEAESPKEALTSFRQAGVVG